jgi:hypothetical protein
VIGGSEVGVLSIPEDSVVSKGRLLPGKMFLIDFAKGRMISDEEYKAELIAKRSLCVCVSLSRARARSLSLFFPSSLSLSLALALALSLPLSRSHPPPSLSLSRTHNNALRY